jgi:hypothetical protein
MVYNLENEPYSFEEAMQFRDVTFRKEAIDNEMASIMSNNNTWILRNLPFDSKLIGCK